MYEDRTPAAFIAIHIDPTGQRRLALRPTKRGPWALPFGHIRDAETRTDREILAAHLTVMVSTGDVVEVWEPDGDGIVRVLHTSVQPEPPERLAALYPAPVRWMPCKTFQQLVGHLSTVHDGELWLGHFQLIKDVLATEEALAS